MNGVRVLLVDDEPDGREVLTHVLSQRGAAVAAVSSVAEALSELERERPDVIVSDIEMPGEDGYALIRRVRGLEAGSGDRIPAAAVTAYARREDRTRALREGFQVHLAKPVDPGELAAVVSRLAAEGRAARG